MDMREVSKELYEIMFANNLLAMQKYEMVKTLVEKYYQTGYCDGMKDSDEIYFRLFSDDFVDEEW